MRDINNLLRLIFYIIFLSSPLCVISKPSAKSSPPPASTTIAAVFAPKLDSASNPSIPFNPQPPSECSILTTQWRRWNHYAILYAKLAQFKNKAFKKGVLVEDANDIGLSTETDYGTALAMRNQVRMLMRQTASEEGTGKSCEQSVW
jgi:hypothetical protein